MQTNRRQDQPSHTNVTIGGNYVILLLVNLAAWIWAWTIFSDRPALLGSAVLAYVFGLRHAFDPDHIAAIDNIVRKLIQDGKQPHSVGFFFSLGHSTIVVLASVVIAVAAAAVKDKFDPFRDIGGAIGTAVSALFLLLIGIANLFILRAVWSAFVRMRAGDKIIDDDLNQLFVGRTFLTAVLRPVFRLVTRSWHMYPIGFLFGLGFDTATEIGLLGISATQAVHKASFCTIMVFPALFTAGMVLMDTADSVLMTRAYGWAFISPVRKLWYNLTITTVSVLVAIFIGGLEALGLIADRLGLSGTFWTLVSALNGNVANFGFAVVGIFMAGWIASVLVYRASGVGSLDTEGDVRPVA